MYSIKTDDVNWSKSHDKWLCKCKTKGASLITRPNVPSCSGTKFWSQDFLIGHGTECAKMN